MTIKEFVQSPKFKWLLVGMGSIIVLLLVFQAGVSVGFRKARFSFMWGDNYHQAFGGPKGGVLRDFAGKDFISGHGTAGAIVRIDANNIIIKGQDGIEKIVTISDQTSIKQGNSDIKVADLKPDEPVVVIGSPNEDGSIRAKIIRIFDPNMRPPFPPPFGINQNLNQ